MATYRIRPFAQADASSVQQLVATVLANLDLPMDASGVDADLFDVPAAYLGGCFLVVEVTDPSGPPRVVGCGGIHDEGDGTFELRKMYFLPELRGRGMGKKLLRVLLDVARQKGALRLRLETNRKMGRAIALYEAFGFRALADADPIPPRCDVVMELRLCEEATPLPSH